MPKKVLLALLALSLLLAACGPAVTLKEGESWNVEISNCPQGSVTTLIIANDGAGPAGVSIRGVNGILKAGDEIVREVDCGNGKQNYALGKISSINTTDYSVKIEIYETPVKK